MEVTKREILLSITILAVMIGIGVWISSPILSKANNRYIETASSVVVSDAEKFGYIKRTDAGRFIANGTLSVIDTIRIDGLPKPYSYVKKDKEEYRLHVETYTTTDGKGHTTTHTRTYHSWDVVKTWKYRSERGRFLGQEFKMDEVFRYHPRKDTVVKVKTGLFENDTRYVYYTCPSSFNGIMIGEAQNKEYRESRFIEGKNSDKYLEDAARSLNAGTAAFWIGWILLTGLLIVGFYYFENKWLY